MEFAVELRVVHQRLEAGGYEVRPLIIGPVAVPAEIEALERRLGIALPPAYRKLLLSVSAEVEFRWFAPMDARFEAPFHENFSGDLHWSIVGTEVIETARRGWVQEIFANRDDPYDRVWHDKLAFYDVGNGDFLAFDVGGPNPDRVVYLSHDDGEGHGYALAEDVIELLVRWVPLACAGGEDWQWLPFTVDHDSGLQPSGANAAAWRRLLGLSGD